MRSAVWSSLFLASLFFATAAAADIAVPPEERCDKAGDSCRNGRGRCESAGFECQAGSCRQHGDEQACQKAGCSWEAQFSCRDIAAATTPTTTSPTTSPTTTTAPVAVPAPAGCSAVSGAGLSPFFALLLLVGVRRRR